MPFTPPLVQIIFSLHFVGFSINEACILLRDDYIIYIALYIASKLRHKAETFFTESGETGHGRSGHDISLADAGRR